MRSAPQNSQRNGKHWDDTIKEELQANGIPYSPATKISWPSGRQRKSDLTICGLPAEIISIGVAGSIRDKIWSMLTLSISAYMYQGHERLIIIMRGLYFQQDLDWIRSGEYKIVFPRAIVVLPDEDVSTVLLREKVIDEEALGTN